MCVPKTLLWIYKANISIIKCRNFFKNPRSIVVDINIHLRFWVLSFESLIVIKGYNEQGRWSDTSLERSLWQWYRRWSKVDADGSGRMRLKWPLLDNRLQEAGKGVERDKAAEWGGHLILTHHLYLLPSMSSFIFIPSPPLLFTFTFPFLPSSPFLLIAPLYCFVYFLLYQYLPFSSILIFSNIF